MPARRRARRSWPPSISRKTIREARGFSPRNLRRMRELYRAYADNPELRAPTLKLGWTQNVAILEGCEGVQERAWYLRAALEHRWTKAEPLERIQAGVWLQSTLDEQLDSCYTEENTVSVECLEHEEDPFVCHGNICRSPMAEYVMKDLVKKAGLEDEFQIASAATSREEIGNPATLRPGGSWRSTASPAAVTPPGASATATTRSTTYSLEWTGPTSATATASAAATSTTRCTS